MTLESISDSDVWHTIDPQHLWIYDRLILARRLGHLCGPAGVAPERSNHYIVRPCVNFRMMGRGARVQWIAAGDTESVPDGSFWCERFVGRHLSIDYHWGKQVLAVEGFRDDPDRLDRFRCWRKVPDQVPLPPLLQSMADSMAWLNTETIGGKIIEAHARYNDDFQGHDATEIYPVWREDFYASACGDRLGFLLGPCHTSKPS